MKKISLFFLIFFAFKISQAQKICLTEFEKSVIELINEKRLENNLEVVQLSKSLIITANKNVKEIITQNYLSYTPENLTGYKGKTAQVRYTTTADSPSSIVNSLATPSKYTKNYSVLFNTDEYQNTKWKSIGICIRSGNISIFMGETIDTKISFPICNNEVFFEAEPVATFPTLVIDMPETASIMAYSINPTGKKERYEVITQTFEVKKGTTLRFPLNAKGAVSYEVYFSESLVSIVPQKQVLFKINATEIGDVTKTISFKGNSINEIEKLLATGYNINKWENGEYQGSLLSRAVKRNNFEAVNYLINKGVDVNSKSKYLETAISFCVSDEMFNLLKSKNADLKSINSDFYTLLHSMSFLGNTQAVDFLVTKEKMDVNALAKEKVTPLYLAVSNNHFLVAEFLLKSGANTSVLSFGKTPLHEAISNKNIELVKLLVKYKANINQPNSEGKKPLTYSKEFNKKSEIESYLKSVGAKE